MFIIIIITVVTAAVVTDVKWDNVTNTPVGRKHELGQ
jgi:hypothetical protein